MRSAFVAAIVLVATAVVVRAPAGATEPNVAATFAARSYVAGEHAQLVVVTSERRLTVQLLRAFPRYVKRDDVMQGHPVAARLTSVGAPGRRTISIAVGHWPGGLYFARVTARGGLVRFAPFVLRPRRLGESRVAVVLPTNTWQAYNFRDSDGDGVGDTWYASPRIHSVKLTRPFLNRGVPPHFRAYDAAFLHWLTATQRRADFLTDDDLERVRSGDELARLYDLIVFPGHEEYVTEHAYDVVERYRDRGGNLMFLSANDFFRKVVRRGDRIFRLAHWRDLGRPEARLIGIQYVDWNHFRFPNRSYRVVGVARAPWLFRGTGLRDGSRFGSFGIEVDARTPSSPPGTRVLARIADIFGPGQSAEMTYYETSRGAKVFAAGALNFGAWAWFRPVSTMLDNLWAWLSRP